MHDRLAAVADRPRTSPPRPQHRGHLRRGGNDRRPQHAALTHRDRSSRIEADRRRRSPPTRRRRPWRQPRGPRQPAQQQCACAARERAPSRPPRTANPGPSARWQRRTGGQLVRRTRSDHHREQSRPGPRSDSRRLGQRRRRRAAVDDNGVAKSERSRPKCASPRRYVPSRPAQRTGAASRRTCLPGRGSHRHLRPVRRRSAGHLPEGTK
jgi:hypothetical protein